MTSPQSPPTPDVEAVLEGLRDLHALALGCSSCDYDEADGELFRHCAHCQLEITKQVWALLVPTNAIYLIERLRANDARYRWLRMSKPLCYDQPRVAFIDAKMRLPVFCIGDELDKQVDAALASASNTTSTREGT